MRRSHPETVSRLSRNKEVFLESFQFRWLKIKEIYAAFPISVTLISNNLK